MIQESASRSFIKTISWRVWATCSTMILVLVFTGDLKVMAMIGSLEVIAKLFLYYLHERLWNRIKFGKYEIQPVVFWLTGLPCSGKTAIGKALVEKLQTEEFKVEHLDGDNIRHIITDIGFSKTERDHHAKRVGHLASKLEKNGIFVIATLITPYEESRNFVRGLCNNFMEVYVSTPLEVCEKRDVKGHYQKARNGELINFTGIDDPYEVPKNPEVSVDTTSLSVEECAETIFEHFRKTQKIK